MRIGPFVSRLTALGSACLLCTALPPGSAQADPGVPGISLQAPAHYAPEPFSIEARVGQAPAAPADVVLVVHDAQPGLQVFTDAGVLDSQSTVTDATGSTVTVRLWNDYKPVTAGQVWDRRVYLKQLPVDFGQVSVTAEVVDQATGKVESSTTPQTVSRVSVSQLDTWKTWSGATGYSSSTMPLAQSAAASFYTMSFQPDVAPALPGAYPTLMFSAAQLRAAGYTAAQLGRALEIETGVGWDGPYRAASWMVGADGSLGLALPAVDLAPPASPGQPVVNYYWRLMLAVHCGIGPGTLTGTVALHAADGQPLTEQHQTFAITRGGCWTHDFTGDGRPDLLARDRSGVLWLYPGTGKASAPYGNRIRVGAGWNAYTSIVAAGDLTGDGHDDLLARDGAGRLWLFPGTGRWWSPFGARVAVNGHGLPASARLVADGPLYGDGQDDVLAISGSVVSILHGTGKAAGAFSSNDGTSLPLDSYNAVVGAGRMAGEPWFAARDRAGSLWLVPDTFLDPAWPPTQRVRVGGGWQAYNAIVQSGDLSGSGNDGLVARDGAGRLWRFTGAGNPARPYQAPALIGGGWQNYTLLT